MDAVDRLRRKQRLFSLDAFATRALVDRRSGLAVVAAATAFVLVSVFALISLRSHSPVLHFTEAFGFGAWRPIPRFGTWQKGKLRPIDDALRSKLNAAIHCI